jgi:hypothetical protein
MGQSGPPPIEARCSGQACSATHRRYARTRKQAVVLLGPVTTALRRPGTAGKRSTCSCFGRASRMSRIAPRTRFARTAGTAPASPAGAAVGAIADLALPTGRDPSVHGRAQPIPASPRGRRTVGSGCCCEQSQQPVSRRGPDCRPQRLQKPTSPSVSRTSVGQQAPDGSPSEIPDRLPIIGFDSSELAQAAFPTGSQPPI